MATRDSRRWYVPPPGMLTGLRRGVALTLLTLVAFLGGVATTQLWPVHTQTQYFAADVSVAPTLDSTVHLPMVVGDVVMSFDGPLPAPGLRAQVSVREEITDLLRSGRLSTATLEPTQEELRSAIDDGVREVAWKFATGALVTSMLVLITYAVARPHHLGRVVAAATTLREPHRVARYLEDTAASYHRFYDNCRVLPMGDEEPSDLHRARLRLVEATRIVLANGLDLLGVSAPERM